MQKKWWMEAVGYQIYPRSFYDTNGDGIGDIKGVTEKLDYLRDLGITMIWLCPFYKSPMDDNGYDVSDYFDIAEDYGTIEDVKELISEAHKRDIKIVADLVLNHTSDEHPWFIESRKSNENPYRDFYIWKPGKIDEDRNEIEPTNWASFFGGSAWKKDETTGEYFMKIFSNKMPDLNWENPKLREEMYKMTTWWIEMGIDGFRVDAVSHITRDTSFTDAIKEGNEKYVSDWTKFTNLPKVHDHLKELNEKVLSKHDIMTVGEVGGEATIDDALKYSGYDSNEFNMVFNFSHNWCNNGLDAKSYKEVETDLIGLKKAFSKWQEGMYGKGWNPLYWLNHDHPRVATMYGNTGSYHNEACEMLCNSLYFMWGTPFIYNGEEIGMTNYPFTKIEEFNDVAIHNKYSILKSEGKDTEEFIKTSAIRTRDNARTPMQWNDSETGGFTEGTPWMKVNPNKKYINVEAQLKDEKSILNHYKKVIDLRKNSEYKDIIVYGDYELIDKDNKKVYSYIRNYNDKKILIVSNFFESETIVNLENVFAEKIIISNYNDSSKDLNSLRLRPFESIVYEIETIENDITEPNQDTFKCYLDDMNTIHGYIKNSYYDGVTKNLRLKFRKESKNLNITKVFRGKEYTKYIVNLDEKINIGNQYIILDDHGLRTTLEYRDVVKTEEFDKMFYYEGNDLGNIYTKEETSFKIWSPIANEVKLCYEINGKKQTLEMNRLDKGVWSIDVEGDLDEAAYTYLLNLSGNWKEATDPYAYTSTPNHEKSVVINLDKINIDLNHDKKAPLKSFTDAVIYELHVRDFSVHENSNIENKGKFLGVIEKPGLNYLKDLGITHIQFLPIYDFGSVDEENQFDFYNWGYDPVQYNVPEGSYASNVYDPYSRVLDLKKMVSGLHEVGLRVNMDVVYNHMFDRGTSAFEQIIPGYYFRTGDYGEISNGSFCGNDVESRSLMVRKYIIDSVKRWIKIYGIDGFRFDLMGIVDVETMNELRKEINDIDSTIMIYGEGWNMPTLIPEKQRSTMFNWERTPVIGHFNDRFRDRLREFVCEEEDQTNVIIQMLQGSLFDYKENEKMFGEPHQTINYIECHDNETFWDKLNLFNDEESDDTRRYRQRLGTAIVLLSQGISLLHAGQEFNRTKYGDHNSYMSPDSINKFDWDRKKEYIDDVNYIKALINIRKSHKGFRLDSASLIKEHVKVKEITEGIIDYSINNVEEYGDYSQIKVLINGTNKELNYELNDAFDVFAYDDKASDKAFETVKENVEVKPLSITLLMRK